jgi:hypothetical protein
VAKNAKQQTSISHSKPAHYRTLASRRYAESKRNGDEDFIFPNENGRSLLKEEDYYSNRVLKDLVARADVNLRSNG